MKRLKRFSEADNRHIRGCAYCQSKLLKNSLHAFNESEKKQGSQMRADEDAVFQGGLPEKAPHSASERLSEIRRLRARLAELEAEDDSEGYSGEGYSSERDVRRGARAGESQKFLKEALAVTRKYSRESKRKN